MRGTSGWMVVGGALVGLGACLAPLPPPIGALLAILGVAFLAEVSTWGDGVLRRLWLAVLVTAGYALATVWMVPTLGDRFGAVEAVGLWLLLAAYGGGWVFVALWAASLVRMARPSLDLAMLPLSWAMAEMVRAEALGGYDWPVLGQVIVGLPGDRAIFATVGVHGASALVVTAAVVLRSASQASWGRRIERAVWRIGAVSLGVIALVIALTPNVGPTVETRVGLARNSEGLFDLRWTEGLALVVAPEGALGAVASEGLALLPPGAPALAGAMSQCRTQGRRRCVRNTVISIGHSGSLGPRVHKQRLVPFWEGDFLGWPAHPGRVMLPAGPHESGVVPLGILRAGVLICYEVVAGAEARARVRAGAEILVNPSSDAWARSAWPADQLIRTARLRAMETGRPVVRASDVGPSGHADVWGRWHHAAADEAAVIVVERPVPTVETLIVASPSAATALVLLLALMPLFMTLAASRSSARESSARPALSESE